jgi:hypothetical protein
VTRAMTTAETKERKRTGRPPKYGQGRITSTVRHTPERYAELKAAAEQAGRSISEEVEFRIERDARADAEHQADLAQLYDHQKQIGRHQQEVRTLREELKALKEKGASDKGSIAMDDERAARIAAAAIAAFVDGRKK